MRTCLSIAAILLATIFLQHQAVGQISPRGDPLRQGYALLIGNSHYKDPRWPQLDEVPLQLNALRAGLANHFNSVEVVQNLETEALRQKIDQFLRVYGNDRSARLFIYYAGHGYSETIFEYNEVRGYITGTDTPYIDGSMPAYDAARLKSISMPQLSSPLQEILARHVLFLFDSCFAGTIFSTRAAVDFPQPMTPDVVARLMEKPARDFITAGGKDQRVPARSPIPALFLEALNGAADHYRHGVISATEIQLYLQDRVLQMRDLNLTPQQGRLPHVAFAEGKFLFRVANRYVLPPQPAPSPVPTSTRSSQLTKDDIKKLFVPFEKAVARVGSDYIERPDDIRLLLAAIDGMKIAFPSAQAASFTAKSAAVASNRASGGGGAVDLSALHDMALQILNNGSEADDARLIGAAINGMLVNLDPHSSYLDSKSFRDMQAQTRGEFGGLGIEVAMKDGLVKVVAPIDETPAARAGIMTNDIITHIDDEPVKGLTLSQAVAKLRGPVNTKIKLKFVHEGQDKPVEMSITRDTIRARAVRWRLEGDDVGFIRVTQFNEQTTEGLKKAITDLSAQAGDKLKGFIIDLRNNPGGLLDQAVSVSDAFLEKGEIVSVRGRDAEKTQRFNARAGELTNGKPMIVLINGGSAAASEIVAGALQDHRRATILGMRSFGRGSIQTIVPLGAGEGALRLTTGRFFTPSGRPIQDKGIFPDIEVLQDVPSELNVRTDARSYLPSDPKDDKVLHTALDLIRGIQKNSAYPPNPKTAVPN